MEIIVTKYFEKNFNKVSKDLNLEELYMKINIESKNFILFSEPYFKVKIRSKNKSYRLLLIFDRNINKILLINFFDKKDKIYWDNISWKLHKEKILEWRNKNTEDILRWKYIKKIIK